MFEEVWPVEELDAVLFVADVFTLEDWFVKTVLLPLAVVWELLEAVVPLLTEVFEAEVELFTELELFPTDVEEFDVAFE